MTNSITKFLAEEKLLAEVSVPHDTTTDIIHNWICDQDNDAIYKGIVEQDKTIKGAIAYCGKKAQEAAESGAKMAMIDYETSFVWITEYFSDPTIEKEQAVVAKVQAPITSSSSGAKKSTVIQNPNEVKPKKSKVKKPEQTGPVVLDGQLDMFADFGLDL